MTHSGYIFKLRLIQPKFDELYEKYKEIFVNNQKEGSRPVAVRVFGKLRGTKIDNNVSIGMGLLEAGEIEKSSITDNKVFLQNPAKKTKIIKSGKLETAQIHKIISLTDLKLRTMIRTTPVEEKEIQDAFENLLLGAGVAYSRETESIEYSTKTYTPDFSVKEEDLVVEIKLCNKKEREKKIIPEINDDIMAYKTKHRNVIFIVYDTGFIRDTEQFSRHFEEKKGVVIKIIKN